MPEIRALDDAETLTYLHRTISTKRHDVARAGDADLSGRLLAEQSCSGGLDPMLGDTHLRR